MSSKKGKKIKSEDLYGSIEDQIKAITSMAKTAGIPSFILGFKGDPVTSPDGQQQAQVSFHFEAIKIYDAVQILISGLHQAVSMELAQHPEYTDEYRDIFESFLKELNEVVANVNTRVANYKEGVSRGKSEGTPEMPFPDKK